MNSSPAPLGPRVLNSLITTGALIGVGDGVGVGDGSEVGLGDGEGGAGVGAGVGVGVGVGAASTRKETAAFTPRAVSVMSHVPTATARTEPRLFTTATDEFEERDC